MAERQRNRIDELFAEGTVIDRALRRGVQEALRRRKLLGLSIVVWRDGQAVWLPPEEIKLSEPPNGNGQDGADAKGSP
jgi:hypothetical protein